MSEDPAYWERRLKEEGLSARRDEDWRHYPRVSHRRRTHREQAKLKQWVEEEGLELARKLGLRRK